ncbi:MAG: SigE family RNA polymerase sigma factor [Nocardioides sp.]|nr:SigE family RNA polymerase sigma factor [Nocardioides sp.]
MSDADTPAGTPVVTPVDPSFDDWVEARAAPLLRFAYLVTGSQQDAEDAVQSALTRACEKWSRVRRADDPDAYVRRMVVNAHVSRWRRSGRRELSVAEVRDSTVRDPAEAIARDDAVWRVCSGLPRQQRAAVVLRFYEDLEYAEIATVLGVSQVAVRTYIHRALVSLRAELTQEDTDG